MTENEMGDILVEAAIQIHRELGPGLLESVYEMILARKLEKLGIKVERQVVVPVEYEGERLAEAFRADIILEQKVIVELKSTELLARVHQKQVLTYLRLTGLKLGYVLNFGQDVMRKGISRVINGEL